MFIFSHQFSQENYNTFAYFPNFLTDCSWDSEKHKTSGKCQEGLPAYKYYSGLSGIGKASLLQK